MFREVEVSSPFPPFFLTLFRNHFFSSPPPSPQLISVTAGFLLLILLSRGQLKYSLSLKILSSTLWFVAILNVLAFILGTAAIPLVIVLFTAAAILSMTWKKQPHRPKKLEVKEEDLDKGPYMTALSSVSSFYDEGNEKTQIEIERKEGSLAPKGGKEGVSRRDVGDEADVPSTSSSVSFGKVETIHEIPHRKDHPEVGGDKGEGAGRGRILRRKTPQAHLKALRARENSNLVFVVLLIVYFIVIFWKYPLFLVLLSPVVFWSALKYVLSLSSTLGSRIRRLINKTASLIRGSAWLIFPPPLPTITRMFLYGDRMILRLAVMSMGSLVSSFIIIGLVVGVAATVVMLLLEVQVELTHYASVGVKVWNMTLSSNPQLSQ